MRVRPEIRRARYEAFLREVIAQDGTFAAAPITTKHRVSATTIKAMVGLRWVEACSGSGTRWILHRPNDELVGIYAKWLIAAVDKIKGTTKKPVKTMSRNDIIRRYMELIREASQKKDVFMGNLLCRQHHVDHKAIQVLRGLGWVDTLPSVGTRWVGPIPHDEKELRTMAIKLLRCKNSNAKKPVKVTPIAPEKPAQAEPSMRLVGAKPHPGWAEIEFPLTEPEATTADAGALKPRKRELNLLWGLFKINW